MIDLLEHREDGLYLVNDDGTVSKLDTKYGLDTLKAGRPKVEPITETQTHRHRLVTHTKHKLTFREAKFIDVFMETGDKAYAVKEAGFKVKNFNTKANALLKLDYIHEEIAYRTELYHNALVADRDEILQYFTAVMRGQLKDQFGFDAPLAERTKAAIELSKRIIDAPDKNAGEAQPTVTIKLDWHRDKEPIEGEYTVVDNSAVPAKT